MSDILFGKNNSETDARGGGEEDPFFWTDGRKVVVGRRSSSKKNTRARTAREEEEVLTRVFCDAKARAKRHTQREKKTQKSVKTLNI